MKVRAAYVLPSLLLAILIPVALGAPAATRYDETYRPQIHYSPPRHWMNDPNGLVSVHGEYQLFYQYYPDAEVWGPMHWGHAVSTDLVHWATLDTALEPDPNGMIFSGSAVFDEHNTTGLGRERIPPLVAIFTYHNPKAEANHEIKVESQGLAYSLDHGRTFQKWPQPVLDNPGVRDFRDPKVQWFAPTGRWIMSLAATDGVRFYSSSDLFHWQFESTFDRQRLGPPGVWECPDLIEMQDRQTGERHDVLLVSVNPNASEKDPPSVKRSGTQYYLGHFDGHTFEPDAASTQPRWLDEGADYYAAVSWNRDHTALSTPPVVLGWMSNWSYAQRVPTKSWRGVMAIPRQLELAQEDGRWSLRSVPIPSLKALRRSTIHVEHPVAAQLGDLANGLTAPTAALDANLTVQSPGRRPYALVLSNQQGERFAINVDPERHDMTIDRSHSGEVAFAENFGTPINVKLPESMDAVSFRLLIDRSSIEIFVDEGRVNITTLVFPTTPYTRLRLEGDPSITIQSVDIFGLDSIWSTAAAEPTSINP